MEQKTVSRSEAKIRGKEEKSFMGHPRALANLFGVEVWERFSFYGMSGILFIYMYFTPAQGGLGISTVIATGVVTAYTGGIYFSAVLGAWFADRVFGSERTLFYSAIMVMCGHISMALIPGVVGLCIALPLIAMGGGGVKSNASSMVGRLYQHGDHRRDAGFNIFYMGIYIGAVTGPLLTGLLQVNAGFHYGFGLAAIGMAFGLAQYIRGRHRLPQEAKHAPNPMNADESKKALITGIVIIAALAILFLTKIFNAGNLDLIMVTASIVVTLILYRTMLTDKELTKEEKNKVISFIPLYITSVVFWILYYQQTTVLTLFSDKQLNRDLFGIWTMPISWISSINPFFVLIMASSFAALWDRWGPKQPSAVIKFASAMLLAGLSFVLFAPIANMQNNTAPLLYVIFILFILSIAELLLSPIGLSISTKLAPAKYKTQMLGVFFLSMSLGTALSGTVAKTFTEQTAVQYFVVLAAVAAIFGLLLFAVTKKTHQLMGDVR
ncbi:MAG: oligopeptide:H+ symporter [Micrococcaceae bacterium]